MVLLSLSHKKEFFLVSECVCVCVRERERLAFTLCCVCIVEKEFWLVKMGIILLCFLGCLFMMMTMMNESSAARLQN